MVHHADQSDLAFWFYTLSDSAGLHLTLACYDTSLLQEIHMLKQC